MIFFLFVIEKKNTEFSPLCIIMFCHLETEKLLSEKGQKSSVSLDG